MRLSELRTLPVRRASRDRVGGTPEWHAGMRAAWHGPWAAWDRERHLHASSTALIRTQTKCQIWTAGKTVGVCGQERPLSARFGTEVNSGSAFHIRSLQIADPSSRNQFRYTPGAGPLGCSSLAQAGEYSASFFALWLSECGSLPPCGCRTCRGPGMGERRVRTQCARAAWQRWKPGTLKISHRDVKRNCLHGDYRV